MHHQAAPPPRSAPCPSSDGWGVSAWLRALVLLSLSTLHPVQAADEPVAPQAPIMEPLSPRQLELERLKMRAKGAAPPYVDRLIDPIDSRPGSDLDHDTPDPHDNTDALGLRSVQVESRFGHLESQGQNSLAPEARRSAQEWGMRLEMRQETLNHGEFLLQAESRHRHGSQNLNLGVQGLSDRPDSHRVTLSSLGFPITPSTWIDTVLGDQTSDLTEALRRGYRLLLGRSSVRGLGIHVHSPDFDLRAGSGTRGLMSGGPYPGFESQAGRLSWLGYSQPLGNALGQSWFAGLQFNQAQGLPDWRAWGWPATGSDGQPLLTEDVQSLGLALGYGRELVRSGDQRLRLSALSSRTRSDSGTLPPATGVAQGLYLEAAYQGQLLRHEAGLYRASPGLRFGDTALISDHQGLYWRLDQSGYRWRWNAGAEIEQQNPEHDPSRLSTRRLGLNAGASLRLDSRRQIGGHAYSLDSRLQPASTPGQLAGGNRSLNLALYYQHRDVDWGRSRLNLQLRRNEALVLNGARATGEEIQWEHDWVSGRYESQRPEFATLLGLARDRSTEAQQRYPTLGLQFRDWFNSNWSFGGHLRYTSRHGNLYTSRGLSGALYSEHHLGHGWRMGASVNLNQASSTSLPPQGSAISPLPQLYRSDDKSLLVFLRWEATSGRPYQSLGLGTPGQIGAGSVTGHVYQDTNLNGERDVGEDGVPGVEVLLDERYRTTTDRDGRFEFPMVGTGHHRLSLRADSVPLPWSPPRDGNFSVEVPLRGIGRAELPVVRVGE